MAGALVATSRSATAICCLLTHADDGGERSLCLSLTHGGIERSSGLLLYASLSVRACVCVYTHPQTIPDMSLLRPSHVLLWSE